MRLRASLARFNAKASTIHHRGASVMAQKAQQHWLTAIADTKVVRSGFMWASRGTHPPRVLPAADEACTTLVDGVP